MAAALAATAFALPAGAQAQQAPFAVGAAENYLESQGRGTDQLTNPDYAVRFQPLFADFLTGNDPGNMRVSTDPYRLDWGQTRGSEVRVEYPNRYGATIAARLWIPKDAAGPLPAVIFVNGFGSVDSTYLGLAQGLAEAGYIVMTFDPQGQGRSDVDPEPKEDFCDPAGAWRQPQEGGVTEQGDCAGHDGPSSRPELLPGTPLEGSPASQLPFVLDVLVNGLDEEQLAQEYLAFGPRFVFGALDAVEWLLSGSNPRRALVDESRIGVVGHSAGAYGALVAANADPLERFDAAVSLDGFGPLPEQVAPRVPTMFQGADGEELGPHREPPDPDAGPSTANALRFRDAGIDTMRITLRGSTHQEWSYVPYQSITPFGAPFFNASRPGERVGLYYALAWLDRYVKGAPDAAARLTARRFDGSVDGSSIGAGRFDPAAGGNQPYVIEGLSVEDRLSFLHRSFYDFDGLVCEDARAGC
jgi:dienelactone hydrolase